MAYEMKNNTFSINFNQDNIDSKFPAFKIKLKSNNEEMELAAWIRTGKYGTEISGDLTKAVPVLCALFGKVAKPKAAVQENVQPEAVQSVQTIQKPETDRKSLIR